jgi:eukaryotic-like serine/threonine-protein kinase
LSVDGTRVVTVAQDPKTQLRDVWIVDAVSSTASRVTTSAIASNAAWGPDGNHIMWQGRQPDGRIDLRVSTWKGRWSEELLFTAERATYAQDWSRDGRFVLINADQSNDAYPALSALRTGPPVSVQQYVTGPGEKGDARFSPDGQWVAYESNEAGRPEVRVQSFPDPNRRYTISTAGGMRPRWRRDGRELFYLAPDGGVMAVPITSTPELKLGVARRLFSLAVVSGSTTQPYDVAPDGNRFLVTEVIREETYSPITVVTNWIASLRH